MNATSLLLVDDDTAFRCTLGSELERTGCVVTLAGSGEEALAKLAANEPEIVLLDLRLPGMNGLDVLKTIRERHPAIDVIMLDRARIDRHRHRVHSHGSVRLRRRSRARSTSSTSGFSVRSSGRRCASVPRCSNAA